MTSNNEDEKQKLVDPEKGNENNANHKFHMRIKKIMKMLECHKRIFKIMKIQEFHMRKL